MKRIIKLTSFLSLLVSCFMMLNACFSTNPTPTGDKDSNEAQAELVKGSFMMTASRIDWSGAVMTKSYFVYDYNGNREYELTVNSNESCVIYSLTKSVYDENNLEIITQFYTLYDYDEETEKLGMKDDLISYYETRLYDGDKVIWKRNPVLKYEKEYIYDENDQLVQVNHISSGDSDSYTVLYEYDEYGNIIKETKVYADSSKDRTVEFAYQYDSEGRIIKEDDMEYVYDDEGRVVEKSDLNYIEQYTYVSTPTESRKNMEKIEKKFDLTQIDAETDELVEELLGSK